MLLCKNSESWDGALTKGWFYEAVAVSKPGQTAGFVTVKCNDNVKRTFATARFSFVEPKKKLTLKNLFIGKIVIANYSEPETVWVSGLAKNPIGEVIVKVTKPDGCEVSIHPDNLLEIE